MAWSTNWLHLGSLPPLLHQGHSFLRVNWAPSSLRLLLVSRCSAYATDFQAFVKPKVWQQDATKMFLSVTSLLRLGVDVVGNKIPTTPC